MFISNFNLDQSIYYRPPSTPPVVGENPTASETPASVTPTDLSATWTATQVANLKSEIAATALLTGSGVAKSIHNAPRVIELAEKQVESDESTNPDEEAFNVALKEFNKGQGNAPSKTKDPFAQFTENPDSNETPQAESGESTNPDDEAFNVALKEVNKGQGSAPNEKLDPFAQSTENPDSNEAPKAKKRNSTLGKVPFGQTFNAKNIYANKQTSNALNVDITNPAATAPDSFTLQGNDSDTTKTFNPPAAQSDAPKIPSDISQDITRKFDPASDENLKVSKRTHTAGSVMHKIFKELMLLFGVHVPSRKDEEEKKDWEGEDIFGDGLSEIDSEPIDVGIPDEYY
ncbi:MAG: hypothetical protein LBI69_05120 [Puniceicoccales bacterium]|jgi:hypothetical protein|nr:hypothetical protein [Puniceicoccales bacterium]